MEKKAKYDPAKIEFVHIDVKDIIATSPIGDGKNVEDDYGWTKPGGSW